MVMFLVLVLCTGSPSPDGVARAKVFFQSGKTHYELGNFSEAIRDFAAGYALSPRPEFLVNLGQAYRATNDLPRAIELFEKYLERAPADAAARAEVSALVIELRAQVAAKRAAADAPLTTPALEPPRPAPAPLVTNTKPEEAPVPPWVLPVAAGVLVGVGVALAVGFATAVDCGPARTLGCVDLRTR